MAPRVPSLLRQLLYRMSRLGGIREEVAQGRTDWGEKEDRAEGELICPEKFLMFTFV